MARLQTPQSFINADPVMRNLRMESWLLPDEESFYRWIEPVRDGWGAVVCAGTAFLVRRRALDGIGGFVEGALSEDYVTGIALRAQGWKLLYLQQKLSAGLAAESMEDFVQQRQRWANGTLQNHGPLRACGLSPGQKLAYLEGVIHWLNNLPRLVLMLMPLNYGLLGVAPILLDQRAIIELMLPAVGNGAAQHRLAEPQQPISPADRTDQLGAHRSAGGEPDLECPRFLRWIPGHPQASPAIPGRLVMVSGASPDRAQPVQPGEHAALAGTESDRSWGWSGLDCMLERFDALRER